MTNEQLQGSLTARNGFRNEDDIVSKFNNWEHDEDSQKWLVIMGYEIKDIEYVKAVKVSGYKTDVNVQITIKITWAIDVQNIQVKLVSNNRGFNQIDKRWVTTYSEMWNMPLEIELLFKRFTGEVIPSIKNPRDTRRMFIDEFTAIEQEQILAWLKSNKTLIISDILKGRGQFAAEWMLVAQKVSSNSRWILVPINYCLNYFGNGDVKISPQGSLLIGKITIQRKGGDNGRPTANMLQFKINPAELFS